MNDFARRVAATILTGGLLVGSAAQAEIAVGAGSGTGSDVGVRTFANDADGDVAPIRVLNRSAPKWLSFEREAQEFYVSSGSEIAVYGHRSTHQSPRRTIQPMTSEPLQQNAPNRANNELHVIVGSDTAPSAFVATYPLDASGPTQMIRRIALAGEVGSATRLNSATGLEFHAGRGELFVGDFRPFPPQGGSLAGEVLIFDRLASGLTAPLRVIEGPLTRLGTLVMDMALDTARDELYVLVSAETFLLPFRIVVFDATANGDVAPVREIAGSNAELTDARGVAFDAANDRAWVTRRSGAGAATSVLGFPRTANGDVAPTIRISGPATGLVTPVGIEAFQPDDRFFSDGFE